MVDNVRYLQSQPSMLNVEGWLSIGAMVVAENFLFCRNWIPDISHDNIWLIKNCFND